MKNPQLAKKLGEVLAFALVGQELLERAGKAGETAFGASVKDMQKGFDKQVSASEKIADQAKTERTVKKLRSMMEQYIGDEWDNPTEILEWSGFYLGSAGVHWSLVSRLSTSSDEKLASFAAQQTKDFFRWLELASDQIKTLNS